MIDVTGPERRIVTILFCDLSDSTGISAGLEPEQFAELLAHIRIIAERVIPAHGGEMIRLDGDGMICLFGFPDAHEDAGRRATEAAIDMHTAIAELDLGLALADRRLQLHSGIHAGMVLLRRGDVVRGKYEILGETTNSAARICDAALPSEILVSAQTLGGERHMFVTGRPRDVTVRGRAKPIVCLSVEGRAVVHRRYEARVIAGLTPFQGREEQCRQFIQWLANPNHGSTVLHLHGPAGIGKSRLLQAMADQARNADWLVVQSYCEAYLGARPLQPFHQAAMTLRPASASNALDAAALEDMLLGEAKLVLMIDDWQWADDASTDLLSRLLAQTDNTRLRFVLASREGPIGLPGDDPIFAIALPPLDRDAALGLVESLISSPDPFVVGRIEQAAGGSPLLIEELCHAVAAGLGTEVHDARGSWFDLAVQSRFDRILARDAELLKLSAVIGHMVPIWLIEALQGQALDDRQILRLQDADFLFPSDTAGMFRFKHGLTRDALYAAIGMAERKALHADVLAALEDAVADHAPGALLDGLAYHAIASGDAAKGLPYALAAGDAALATGALDRAQGHYLAAMTIVSRLPTGRARRDAAWTLLNKYGLACIIDPAPDQLQVLEQAQAILVEHGNQRDAMRAAYWLGSIAYGVGFGKRSVRHLQAALALAEASGTSEDRLLIESKLAQSCFISGQLTRAAALFAAVLPQLDGFKHNLRGVAAYAHANHGFMQGERGDFAQGERQLAEAEAILADPHDPINASILLYRASMLVSQGLWEPAIIAAEAVLAVSQRSRARMQNRKCRAEAAYARWKLTGDAAHARVLEHIALEQCTPGHSLQYASQVFGWAVEAMVALGETGQAAAFMGHLARRVRDGGDWFGTATAWRALALAAQREGQPARALRRLAAAKRSVARQPSRREAAHNMVCQARLWQVQGRTTDAAALLTRAAQEFAAMAMPWFQAEALSLLQPAPVPAQILT